MITIRKELIILNAAAILIYFIVLLNLNIGINNEIFFSTPDALTFRDVSNFLLNDQPADHSVLIRPFFYPLLITLFYKPFGVFGLWSVHFVFWIASLNLLFLSIRKTTGSRILSFTGAIIMSLNLTLITLTLHAISEVSTIFLLSITLYFLTNKIEERRTLNFFHTIFFCLALLSVLKPLFFPFLLLLTFIILPLFYLRAYLKKPAKLLILMLLSLPVVFQLSIMKVNFNMLKVSDIDRDTFRDYIFAQGYSKINNLSRNETLEKVKDYQKPDIFAYMARHKSVFIDVYLENLKDNCNGKPGFLSYPKEFEHVPFRDFMVVTNSYYSSVYKILWCPALLMSILFLRRKRYPELILVFSSTIVIYYILLTSGISAWQDDRLAITTLPLWLFLLAFIIFSLKKINTLI
ncbi:MAG: hypothetical protein K0Q95_2329 [Bacteroidota bacterium]|jgi:4-amino-4-deoxy-L-arabinose transferase-like glycosyltransferase|nr:hypothetical protein [Bacteroidota bacterium]